MSMRDHEAVIAGISRGTKPANPNRPANETQVGGDHYKKGGEEHWDRAWRLKYDPFQYIITKWVERWKDKGGLQDLKKAQHALQKYIEVVEAQADCASEAASELEHALAIRREGC